MMTVDVLSMDYRMPPCLSSLELSTCCGPDRSFKDDTVYWFLSWSVLLSRTRDNIGSSRDQRWFSIYCPQLAK